MSDMFSWPWKKKKEQQQEAPQPAPVEIPRAPQVDYVARVEAVRKWRDIGKPYPKGDLADMQETTTADIDRILRELEENPDLDDQGIAQKVLSTPLVQTETRPMAPGGKIARGDASPADCAAKVEAVRKWMRIGRPYPKGDLAALSELTEEEVDAILDALTQNPDSSNESLVGQVFA